MKNCIKLTVKQATVLLLAFVFLAITVFAMSGKPAKAQTEPEKYFYYFTDYHENDQFIYGAMAAAGISSVTRIDAQYGDAVAAAAKFCDEARSIGMQSWSAERKQNTYVIIEIRSNAGLVIVDDPAEGHPLSNALNELTTMTVGCKTMLILGTFEDRITVNGPLTFLKNNVNIHVNLDFYHIFACSALYTMLGSDTYLHDCNIILNKDFQSNYFFRFYLMPFILERNMGEDDAMDYLKNLADIYSLTNGNYNDADLFNDTNGDFNCYLDVIAQNNIRVLFQQENSTYTEWEIQNENSQNYQIEENSVALAPNDSEYIAELLSSRCYAVGARWNDNVEQITTEENMCALRDISENDFDIFTLNNGGSSFDENYDEQVYYCTVSNYYFDEYLTPVVIDFLCDAELTKYDRFDGICQITDMPMEFSEDGWLKTGNFGVLGKLIIVKK